jgi:AraC-like DNA-binding protein
MFLVLHIGWIPFVYYLTADAIRKVFVWYVLFFSLLLLPVAFVTARRNDPSSCLYFLVIPLSCYVMLRARKAIIGCVVFAFVLILAAYLPHYIYYEELQAGHGRLHSGDSSLWVLHNLLNLLIVFLHICLSVYYIDRLHTTDDMDKSPASVREDPPESLPSAEDDCKYDALYRRIEDFMESKEAFRDPNFSILHLAAAIDCNVKYVSNAIREKTGMNSTNFINIYRVEFAKKALQQKNANHTIEHLGQSSGFQHQTSFNRVFKSIQGITPTEYMKLHEQADEGE